jgi:hypothetical protein
MSKLCTVEGSSGGDLGDGSVEIDRSLGGHTIFGWELLAFCVKCYAEGLGSVLMTRSKPSATIRQAVSMSGQVVIGFPSVGRT